MAGQVRPAAARRDPRGPAHRRRLQPREIADALKLSDATSADVVGLLRSLRGGLFVRVTEQSDHVREASIDGHKVVGTFEGYIAYE